MRHLRWLILGIVSFLGLILVHGSWINRLLAVVLCGLLGADSGLCLATAAKVSGRSVAATSEVVSQPVDRDLWEGLSNQIAQATPPTGYTSWTLEFPEYRVPNSGGRCSIQGDQEVNLIRSGNQLSGVIRPSASQDPTASITGTIRSRGERVELTIYPLTEEGFIQEFEGTVNRNNPEEYSGTVTPMGRCTGSREGDFTLTLDEVIPENDITKKNLEFAFSKVNVISSQLVELYLESLGGEGCQFITTIRKDGDRVYQESMRFVSASREACGLPSFDVQYDPDGNGITINSTSINTGNPERTTFNNLGGEVLGNYIGDYQNSSKRFPGPTPVLPPDPSPRPPTSYNQFALAKVCEFGQGLCNLLGGLANATSAWSGIVTLLEGIPFLAGAVTGAGFVASSQIMLGAFSVGFIVNTTCWLMFGEPDSLPNIPFAEEIFQFFDIVNDGLVDYAYEFAVSDTREQLRIQLREALGLDVCDEPLSAEFLNVTLSSSEIPYGSSAILTVEYAFPNKDVRWLDISGTGFKAIFTTGPDFNIEVSRSRSKRGRFRFRITNTGYRTDDGQCRTNRNALINARVSGPNRSFIASKQVEPLYTGSSNSPSRPCSATIKKL
ncbi:hypothetical protein PMG71_11280 [Roseofilum sp. BLCC_M154]|uniref:Uncharacterized protein n=1 Tax=Roseofilum acuticapitatum BLCC-M154 TaxID=3022444 RepID=A0ABT7ASY1_9CYAN|nr:hypothetical protein [Roseofilum acuticapitatum]MDJ1170009.1 hypothetical protein [Roseofilum acuticapitatum BLCC-M154]